MITALVIAAVTVAFEQGAMGPLAYNTGLGWSGISIGTALAIAIGGMFQRDRKDVAVLAAIAALLVSLLIPALGVA